MPVDSFHLDKVHQTFERLFGTDRHNDRTRVCSQNVLHLADNFEEVGARTVHFVNVCDTRNVVFVGLTPNGFGLRLNATYCTVSSNGAVKNTQRTFHLSGKVNVSRSINQVDFVRITGIFPTGSGGCGGDSDTTFLLLLHPVHCSGTVMHLTDFVGQTRIKQNTFRGCGFSGIDVSHDTDIACQM